jgi:ribosomal protein L37AE/L43A
MTCTICNLDEHTCNAKFSAATSIRRNECWECSDPATRSTATGTPYCDDCAPRWAYAPVAPITAEQRSAADSFYAAHTD